MYNNRKHIEVRWEEIIIEIKGKEKVIEDLEKAERLIKEAHDILWKLPSAIGLEVAEGSFEANDSAQDNRWCTRTYSNILVQVYRTENQFQGLLDYV